MENWISNIVLLASLGLSLLITLRLAYKFYKSHCSKPVTVSAQVIEKHTLEFFSETAKGQQSTRYVVSFLVNGKKKGFYVSSGLYHSCKKGERGMLTYKGDTVLSFQ